MESPAKTLAAVRTSNPSRTVVDVNSRANYARLVRDEAEQRGIGWTYWEFASDFGMYSTETNQWVEPIRRALLD